MSTFTLIPGGVATKRDFEDIATEPHLRHPGEIGRSLSLCGLNGKRMNIELLQSGLRRSRILVGEVEDSRDIWVSNSAGFTGLKLA